MTALRATALRHPIMVLVLLALWAHLGGLANGFVYDDHRFVEANGALEGLTVQQALSDPASHTSDRDRDVYRPLRALSQAFDLHRWGLDPFGFHLHSLLLHIANVILAWQLLRRLLPRAGPAVAILGAGLLAVHPLGVEVVDWISSRGDLLAVCCSLTALLAALQLAPLADRSPRLWHLPTVLLTSVLACLAVLGKESAAVLPLIALAYRLREPGPRSARAGQARDGPGRSAMSWLGVAALAAGVATALWLRQTALEGISPVQTPAHGGSGLGQIGWSLYGLSRLLEMVVIPIGLSVDHPQDLWAQGWPVWLRPRTALGALTLSAPLWLWIRRRRGPALFLLSWALLAWLPSGSLLVTLRSLVTDRSAYPMLIPLGALIGLAIPRRSPWALNVVLTLLVILGFSAQRRVQVFRSDQTLWQDVLTVNPRSVQARLGLALAEEHPERAGALLEQAVAVAIPGSKLEAAALARLGDHRLRRQGRVADAVPILERALAALKTWAALERPGTDLPATASSLALALTLQAEYERAEAVLAEAIAGDEDPLMLLVQRTVLRQLRFQQEGGETADALVEESLAELLKIAPEHPTIAAIIARREALREQTFGGSSDPLLSGDMALELPPP